MERTYVEGSDLLKTSEDCHPPRNLRFGNRHIAEETCQGLLCDRPILYITKLNRQMWKEAVGCPRVPPGEEPASVPPKLRQAVFF